MRCRTLSSRRSSRRDEAPVQQHIVKNHEAGQRTMWCRSGTPPYETLPPSSPPIAVGDDNARLLHGGFEDWISLMSRIGAPSCL